MHDLNHVLCLFKLKFKILCTQIVSKNKENNAQTNEILLMWTHGTSLCGPLAEIHD